MDYSIYIRQLRDRLKQQIQGLSSALGDTELDNLINNAINKGYVGTRPQIDSTRLSRTIGKQITDTLNEEITRIFNNLGNTPLALGKVNASGLVNLQNNIRQSLQTVYAQYMNLLEGEMAHWSFGANMLPPGNIPLGLPAGQQRQQYPLLPAPANLPPVVGTNPNGINIIQGGPGAPTGYTMAGNGQLRLPAPSGAESIGPSSYQFRPPFETPRVPPVSQQTVDSEFNRWIEAEELRTSGTGGGATQQGGAQTSRQKAQAEREAARAERAAQQAAELEAQVNAFSSNPRYQQVIQRLKQQDITNGTQYANNITGISAETNRNVGYVKSAYMDEATGMQMTNKAWFNPQTGQMLTDYSSKFASLTDRIARNTKEFIGWTLAVSLVYVPLQKLGQLMQETIDQEAKLADVSIVMQLSQAGVNKIFFDAADIARSTGESLTGVIEGYAQAAQATAGYKDEAERTAVANKLLYDSIVLAKLSGMSQAESTDTLVAALNQMGLSMDQGTVLLDKWQATARAANVPVATLASTFAIVGAAAEDAGLKMEQLNAITAVVAAAQITSPKETGNAIRGIVAGYTTSGAQNTLREFGISVKDTEGNMRGLLDVYGQVSAMIQSGAIDQSQQNRISMALTGGNRGMSRVTSLLLGMGDINNITAAQENPQGQAQRAIQFELDTTQAKITNLGTAFSELARVMGTEGNILPTFKVLVTLLTSVVDGFTKITGAMGSSSIAALALALSYKSLFSVAGQQAMVATYAGISGRVAGAFASPTTRTMTSGGWVTGKEGATEAQMGRVMGSPSGVAWGTGVGAGILGAGIPALMNLAGGNKQAAEANVIGGVIGGGILGVLGGPAGVAAGATIGSAAGEALINAWNNRLGGKGGVNVADVIPAGVSSEADKVRLAATRTKEEAQSIQDQQTSREEKLQKGMQDLVQNYIKTGTFGSHPYSALDTLTKPNEVLTAAAKALPEQFNKLIKDYLDASGGIGTGSAKIPVDSPFVTLSKKITDELSQTMGQVNTDTKTKLQVDYYSPINNMSRAEYQRQGSLLGTGTPSVGNALTSLYKGSGPLGDLSSYNIDQSKYKTWAEAIKYITDTIIKLPAEQLDELNAMTADMADLESRMAAAQKLGVANPTIEWKGETISYGKAQNTLSQLSQNYPLEFSKRQQQMMLTNAKPPSISNLEIPSQVNLSSVMSEAQKQMQSVLAGMTDDNERQAQSITWANEKAVIKVGDVWKEIKGIPADMLTFGLDEAIKKMENFTPNLGIKAMSATPAQYAEAQKQYATQMDYMQKQFGPMGWKANEEGAIVKLDAQQQGQLYLQYDKKDWSVMEMLLEKIAKNTEPTGVYNLPGGAEFYVPWQAAAMDYNSRNQMANNNTGVNNANTNPTTPAPTISPITGQDFTNGVDYYRELARTLIQNAGQKPMIPGQEFQGGYYKNTPPPGPVYGPPTPYEQNPELFKYGNNGASSASVSVTIPDLKASINLIANTNVTLMIDANVLAKVMSTQMGNTLASSGPAYGTTSNVFGP
jgi:TP901 family phage tail tape measure protein